MTELIAMSLITILALCAGIALGYAIAVYDRKP
jgi:uncharacterized protein YneF (UPF0154 family)